MKSLAEQAGIDTTACEICDEPLDDSRPWRRGLDGGGIHKDCLSAFYRDCLSAFMDMPD